MLATLFFALCIKNLGSRYYILPSLAFAFTPAIFISSVTSIDFMWAMAFILGSLFFVINQRPWIGGLFVGLAIGCRITSGAMLVPFSILFFDKNSKRSILNILILSLSACFIGAITFLPVFKKYGPGFFSIYKFDYPNFLFFSYLTSISFWGVIGSIGILLAFLSLFISGKAPQNESSILLNKIDIISFSIAIIIYIIAFFMHPTKPELLIPVLPFLLLLLGRFLKRIMFNILCILIIISPFFVNITRDLFNNYKQLLSYYKEVNVSGQQFIISIYGPIFTDYLKRKAELELIDRIITEGNVVPKNSVIVAGYWLPKIQASKGVHNLDTYIRALTKEKLKYYQEMHIKIYYLPGMIGHTRWLNGVDLETIGASSLLPTREKNR